MRIAALSVLLFAASCASQIMQGYVGKDITEVMVERGAPSAVFDMPDGRRAFQWQINQGIPMPSTSTTTMAHTGGFGTATTTTTGGGVVTQRCVYTLYAEPAPQDRFTVVGFEPPRLGCE